eukprot:gene16169-24770_t
MPHPPSTVLGTVPSPPPRSRKEKKQDAVATSDEKRRKSVAEYLELGKEGRDKQRRSTIRCLQQEILGPGFVSGSAGGVAQRLGKWEDNLNAQTSGLSVDDYRKQVTREVLRRASSISHMPRRKSSAADGARRLPKRDQSPVASPHKSAEERSGATPRLPSPRQQPVAAAAAAPPSQHARTPPLKSCACDVSLDRLTFSELNTVVQAVEILTKHFPQSSYLAPLQQKVLEHK